jgi:hypothetical protein
MSLEKVIVLSSYDKEDPSQSNSNFVVNLKERNATQAVNRIQVKDISVPNVFPNLRGTTYGDQQNNQLVIDKLGVKTAIVVPEGQYVISTLGVPPPNDFITALESAINTTYGAGTVTITFDETTQKLSFTWNIADYQFVSPTDDKRSLMNDVLGITEADTGTTGLVITASATPFLNGYDQVYIQSEQIAGANGIDGSFGLIPLIESISFHNTPFGGYAHKQQNDSELSQIVYEEPKNLSRIRITLRDVTGNLLDTGTHPITITFKVYFSSS